MIDKIVARRPGDGYLWFQIWRLLAGIPAQEGLSAVFESQQPALIVVAMLRPPAAVPARDDRDGLGAQ